MLQQELEWADVARCMDAGAMRISNELGGCGGMTARSGKITTRAAVVIPRLVTESAHSGADQMLSGGNQTKRSCECGAPAFRGVSTVLSVCLSGSGAKVKHHLGYDTSNLHGLGVGSWSLLVQCCMAGACS